jgi:hypothetical protein
MQRARNVFAVDDVAVFKMAPSRCALRRAHMSGWAFLMNIATLGFWNGLTSLPIRPSSHDTQAFRIHRLGENVPNRGSQPFSLLGDLMLSQLIGFTYN